MARKKSRYFKGQESDQPTYTGAGPRPAGTNPLLPVRPSGDLKASHVIEALKGTNGDYSADSIRASVRRMLDAGTISPKDAGHLAMVTVYAGDRIEGIGAGQAQLGGVKPADERYFEGTPAELAAMRRKRSGSRKEFQTSVPREYQGLIREAFNTEEGSRMVADALRQRFKKGKIPTGRRTVERIEETVRNIKPGGALTLSGKPSDADKDPVRAPAPGKQAARIESRKMSTVSEPVPAKIRKGSQLVSLGTVASEKGRREKRKEIAFRVLRARMPGGRDMTAAERRKLGATEKVEVVGPPRSEFARSAQARAQAREEAAELAFPARPRRVAPRVSTARAAAMPVRMVGGERVPSTASGQAERSDIQRSRMTRRTRLPRGQALEGREKPLTLRPTPEGVLERQKLRELPKITVREQRAIDRSSGRKTKFGALERIDRLRRIMRSRGKVY